MSKHYFNNSYFLGFLILFLFGCSSRNGKEEQSKLVVSGIKYADNFSIEKIDDYTKLTVFAPWKNMQEQMSYILYEKGKKEPTPQNNEQIVQTPIRRAICLSTTQIGFMTELNMDSLICGVSGAKWVHNQKIKNGILTGEVKDVGLSNHLNYELILDLAPDVIFVFGIDKGALTYINKLKELGLKTVVVSEYMETHPLGKAEWIKFMAAFFEKGQLATERFNKIEKDYTEAREMTYNVEHKPSVFTGIPWKGDWFIPGGKSFQANLFEDAGANYLWKDNLEKSGTIVDIEVVFDRALDADFWLNVSNYSKTEDLLALDHRYPKFRAVKEGGIFNNNLKLNDAGGNDYWESGVVRPDIVLKDLIKIFHPELLKEHELFYYQKLH